MTKRQVIQERNPDIAARHQTGVVCAADLQGLVANGSDEIGKPPCRRFVMNRRSKAGARCDALAVVRIRSPLAEIVARPAEAGDEEFSSRQALSICTATPQDRIDGDKIFPSHRSVMIAPVDNILFDNRSAQDIHTKPTYSRPQAPVTPQVISPVVDVLVLDYDRAAIGAGQVRRASHRAFRRSLRRIFNNAKWQHGDRLAGGFWMAWNELNGSRESALMASECRCRLQATLPAPCIRPGRQAAAGRRHSITWRETTPGGMAGSSS